MDREENTGMEKEENTGTDKKLNQVHEISHTFMEISSFILGCLGLAFSIRGAFSDDVGFSYMLITLASVLTIMALTLLIIVKNSKLYSIIIRSGIMASTVVIAFITWYRISTPPEIIEEPKVIYCPSDKIAAGNDFSMLLRSDKTVVTYGPATGINTSDWANITQIAAYKDHAIGLREDGSVVVTGAQMDEYDISDWSNIQQVAACKEGVIGLTKNGTIEFDGPSKTCLLDCEEWTNIKTILGAAEIIVAQLKDDDLMAVDRYQNFGLLNLDFASTIASATAVGDRVLYVLDNGNIEVTGNSTALENQIATWDEIKQLAVGSDFAVGLKKDGKAICLGAPTGESLDVSGWKNITAICAGKEHVLGLCEDGTVLTAGNVSNGLGEIANVNYWVN